MSIEPGPARAAVATEVAGRYRLPYLLARRIVDDVAEAIEGWDTFDDAWSNIANDYDDLVDHDPKWDRVIQFVNRRLAACR